MRVCVISNEVDGYRALRLLNSSQSKTSMSGSQKEDFFLRRFGLRSLNPSTPDSHQPAKSNSIISICQCFLSCTFMLLLEYKVTKNSPIFQIFPLIFSVLGAVFLSPMTAVFDALFFPAIAKKTAPTSQPRQSIVQ